MRNLIPLVAVGVVVVGCGSRVDPALAGEWAGPEMLYVGVDAVRHDESGRLTVDVDEATGTVSGFCPDGSGSLMVAGSDPGNGLLRALAEGSGEAVCPAVSIGDCASVVFAFSEARLSLFESDGSLYAVFDGTQSGCGSSTTAQVLFSGDLLAP